LVKLINPYTLINACLNLQAGVFLFIQEVGNMMEKVPIEIKPIYEQHEINEAKQALNWARKNDPDIAARWARAYKVMGKALARAALERVAGGNGVRCARGEK